ncbi:MAG: lipoprotein [Pseudomonadota bacterium]
MKLRQILVSTLVLAGVAAVTGCGQKGPLVLPTAQPATAVAAPPSAAASSPAR